MEDFGKKYYKIKDVTDFLEENASTLRYWEKVFPQLKPYRSAKGIRYYTTADIELLRIIKFLVHDRGLKIDAAREQLRTNYKNLSKRTEAIAELTELRKELKQLLEALKKRK